MCHTSPTDRTFHCQNQQDWCVLILGHRGAAAISHGKHKMMGCFSLVLYPLHPFADDNLPFNQQFRLLDANMLLKVVKSAGLRCGFKTKNWGDYEQNLLLLVVNALTAMQFLQFLPRYFAKKGVKHVLPMSCELRISSFFVVHLGFARFNKLRISRGSLKFMGPLRPWKKT